MGRLPVSQGVYLVDEAVFALRGRILPNYLQSTTIHPTVETGDFLWHKVKYNVPEGRETLKQESPHEDDESVTIKVSPIVLDSPL